MNAEAEEVVSVGFPEGVKEPMNAKDGIKLLGGPELVGVGQP